MLLDRPILLDRLASLMSTLRRALIPFVSTGLLAVGIFLVAPEAIQAQVPQKIITACACEAQDIHVADLDGDGDSDLLFAAKQFANIAWLENTGGGDFTAQRTITLNAGNAKSVFAADLDGDGDKDALSASAGDDKIAWYENQGNGNFSDQKTITTQAFSAQSVFAADLDGDGDQDVLSADKSDKVAWYENTGGGSFSDQKVITEDADNARSVFAADLDGDGDKDVLSASKRDNKIAWYENTGGSFSDQNTITLDADGARSVFAADLNGDGNTDVLSASSGNDQIAWYENAGDGTFSFPKTITTDAAGAQSVFAADLDGDGDKDVLSASPGDNKIAWYENQGDGSFSDQSTITLDAGGAQSVFAADLTGSGDPDVLSASAFPGDKVAWHENTGGGSFSNQKLLTTKARGPESVHAADLNGDGAKDILSASNSPSGIDRLVWYENVGGGSFPDQKVIADDVGRPKSLYAADVDGDGDQDVVSALAGGGGTLSKIAWYENTGGGSFSDQKTITTEVSAAWDVHVADLTGDGNLDVLSVAASDASSEVAWYENTGGGTFSDQKIITTDVSSPVSVFAADLTGDGDLDVLSASQDDDRIAWYGNQGDGSFSNRRTITLDATLAKSVFAADLTGDGNVDVLSADASGKIAWYENQGGTFSEERIITSNLGEAQSVFAKDLNGDGDFDVLSASAPQNGNGKIAWYANQGGGSFSAQKTITTTVFGPPASVFSADLTGDGDPEVISGSYDDSRIAWYENTDDVLPVELAGLTARAEDGGARLTWQTASETNNAGFYVQHRSPAAPGDSPDAEASSTWERLGFVEGAGTTAEAQSYRFAVEKELTPGTHQFRLRQVDTDGTAHLSKAVSLRVRMNEKVRLSAPVPNPIASEARLTFSVKEAQKTTVRLYDMLGQQVATLYQGRPTAGEPVRLRLDASGLASGTYVVRLEAEGATEAQKAVVVR